MTSEGNWTPNQMWTMNRARNGADIEDNPPNIDLYGIDWNGPLAVDDPNAVTVVEIPCPLSNEDFEEDSFTAGPKMLLFWIMGLKCLDSVVTL